MSIIRTRSTVRLAIALVVAGALAGCGGAGGARQPVSFMIFGDVAEKAAYERLVEAFQERHPQTAIDLIHIPSQNDYRKRLGADFAAGTPADVVLLNYRRYASFAARGVLEPLGPYLDRSALLDLEDFYPEALAPFYWGGALMCVPQNLSSLVVYYNSDLFDRAGVPYPREGWTWDDFLSAAQALTRDLDGDGQADQHGLGTEVSIFRLAPFVWQNGGELVDDPRAPTRLALDSPEAMEATRWFVDLQVKHHVVPSAVEEAAEPSESRFQNGRLAMFLNSRRGVPTYREIKAFEWDVAPLPQRTLRAGILHADAYCMPSASGQKAAAWSFIEFANSAEGQTIIAATGRTVPSLKAVAESPAFLDAAARPSNNRAFLDVIPAIRTVPVMPTWVDIEDLVGAELKRAFYGDVPVEGAIAAAIRRSGEFFPR